jgi:formylglycine-generating enzyme required for sulfatase activity
METVRVGNPGNAGDVQRDGTFGAVPYAYRIGKHEVTNAQYVEFLNGVDPTGANALLLYNTRMNNDDNGGLNFTSGAANGSKYSIKPGRDNNPVVFVNWYDSIRFANWMHNGMGSGDTENGAYTLIGGTPIPSNGNSITRNPGAKWWLPSEDEWYKAAYHKNDGVTANYWDYPTSTDAVPFSDQATGSGAPDPSNTGNFFKNDNIANGYDDGYAVTGSPTLVPLNYLTGVGAYNAAQGPYGTFDQGGNVWEWNEALVSLFGSGVRGIRGGGWLDESGTLLASERRGSEVNGPASHRSYGGFRVATIPEPSTLLLGAIAGMSLLWRRRAVPHRVYRSRRRSGAAF